MDGWIGVRRERGEGLDGEFRGDGVCWVWLSRC